MGVETACSGIKFGQGGPRWQTKTQGGVVVVVGGSGGWSCSCGGQPWKLRTTSSVGGGRQPWKLHMVSGSHGRRPREVNESTKCYVQRLVVELRGSAPPETKRKKEKIGWFQGCQCLQRKREKGKLCYFIHILQVPLQRIYIATNGTRPRHPLTVLRKSTQKQKYH